MSSGAVLTNTGTGVCAGSPGNVSLAPVSTVDEETYRALHNEHRLIADVSVFLDAISTI